MGNKRKTKKGGTFVNRDLYTSRAFLALGGSASKIYLLFLDKRMMRRLGRKGKERWTCINHDNITLTYKELENHGFSKSQIVKALDELLAKGFIKIKEPGGAYRQHKTVYAISDKWRSWRDGDVIRRRKRDVKRGFQGRLGKSTWKLVTRFR